MLNFLLAGKEAVINEFCIVHTLCIYFHLLSDDLLLNLTLSFSVSFCHIVKEFHQFASLYNWVHIILIQSREGHVLRIYDIHWTDLLGPMLEVRAGIQVPSALSYLWLCALGELVNKFIKPAVQGNVGQALHLTDYIGELRMADTLVRDVPI